MIRKSFFFLIIILAVNSAAPAQHNSAGWEIAIEKWKRMTHEELTAILQSGADPNGRDYSDYALRIEDGGISPDCLSTKVRMSIIGFPKHPNPLPVLPR